MRPNKKILITALIIIGSCAIIYPTLMVFRFISNRSVPFTPTPILNENRELTEDLLSTKPPEVIQSGNKIIPFQSVVLITAYYTENGTRKVGWTGSGTFVDPVGLILTNAHVVLPALEYPIDLLTVAPTTQEDRQPDPEYIARVVQADPRLDLAVIKTVSDLNGNPIGHGAMNFPFVVLGDSDRLKLGDSLTILGYPGIGGDTITLTSGEVAGFTGETGYGNRAYIKTSAAIAGGNSGGLAADVSGALVGIPTLLGSGADSSVVDCRILADTNYDGFIDQDDTCIPTGGFINSLRPVNLAKPLIEAAIRGEENVAQQAVPQMPTLPEQSGVLFFDNFSDDSSGWTIYADEDGYVGYSEDKYLIGITGVGNVLTGTSDIPVDNATIQVTGTITQSSGDGGIGLICRQQSDASYYYAMEIREDGFASIWKNDANNEVQLTGWQYVQPIQANTPVTLAGTCTGEQLQFRIDGRLILSAFDPDYSYGYPGLMASTMNTGGFIVMYDDFQIKTPE